MDWNKFAKAINGEYKENYEGGLGGDTLFQEIIQISEDSEIKITKKARRGYEASIHFSVQKFKIEFKHNHLKFTKNRLRRKNWFLRIFRNAKNQYKIDGKLSLKADKIINSKAIETLLRYPKRF